MPADPYSGKLAVLYNKRLNMFPACLFVSSRNPQAADGDDPDVWRQLSSHTVGGPTENDKLRAAYALLAAENLVPTELREKLMKDLDL